MARSRLPLRHSEQRIVVESHSPFSTERRLEHESQFCLSLRSHSAHASRAKHSPKAEAAARRPRRRRLGCGGRGSTARQPGGCNARRGFAIDVAGAERRQCPPRQLQQQLQMAYLQQAYLAQAQAAPLRQQESAARKAELKERQLGQSPGTARSGDWRDGVEATGPTSLSNRRNGACRRNQIVEGSAQLDLNHRGVSP